MIIFPNAKINLGLNVTSRRLDGYHNIETLFYPIGLRDILEVVPAHNNSRRSTGCTLHGTGIDVGCNFDENLVVKAYHLLNKYYPLPAMDIYLWKVIPCKAGLGGGSSDAAFSLKLFNELAELHLSEKELEALAAQLGADCPFFIRNQPVMATGTGAVFKSINVSLKGYFIYIIKPPAEVSTKEAYAGVTPQIPTISVREIVTHYRLEEWNKYLTNDFEASIFKQLPELQRIKEQLYDSGALYASMTGSGSAFYGIFEKEPELKGLFNNCFVWGGILD